MTEAYAVDDVARYNSARWEKMVRAGAVFTRPQLDLTPDEILDWADPKRQLGDVAGKDVLVLAGGGGQQSAAFGLLGARVTVMDLSDAQLEGDLTAAAHYGLTIRVEQGDMRDLSRFADGSFDIVAQPYSINFVPEVKLVFQGVARVLRPGGLYDFNCANPFVAGLTADAWDGTGYALTRPYVEGAEIVYHDEPWVFRGDLPAEAFDGPKEYTHTLSTLVNGLLEAGLTLQHLREETLGEPDITAPPGSGEHFSAVVPRWLRFCARKGAVVL